MADDHSVDPAQRRGGARDAGPGAHPAKLGTDITAEVASTILLWQRKPAAGLLVRLAPSAAASALLVRRDLEPLA